MGNFWGIAFGLLLICFGIGAVLGINIWRFFFPSLVILFGVSILLNQLGWNARGNRPWDGGSMESTTTEENTINYETVFGGSNKKVLSKDFKGGKVTSVFGASIVDLSDARMSSKHTAYLEVNSVFGGVKVIVPPTWSVEGNLTGIFGGFSNKAGNPEKPEGKIVIKGAAVFGGGEITNE